MSCGWRGYLRNVGVYICIYCRWRKIVCVLCVGIVFLCAPPPHRWTADGVGADRDHPATTPLSAARVPIPREVLRIYTHIPSPTRIILTGILLIIGYPHPHPLTHGDYPITLLASSSSRASSFLTCEEHPHPLTHEDYPITLPSILILTGVSSPWRIILTHILISHGHPLSSPVRSTLTGAPHPVSSSSLYRWIILTRSKMADGFYSTGHSLYIHSSREWGVRLYSLWAGAEN